MKKDAIAKFKDSDGKIHRAIYYDKDGVLRAVYGGKTYDDDDDEYSRVRRGVDAKGVDQGIGPFLRDRKAEFAALLRMDDHDDKEGDADHWCIIEANWINAWLASVYYNVESPSPGRLACSARKSPNDLGMTERVRAGAIDNTSLLKEEPLPSNPSKFKFVPKEDLECANGQEGGHYRLVTERVWQAYVDLYPDSGPKILSVRDSYMVAVPLCHPWPPLADARTTR